MSLTSSKKRCRICQCKVYLDFYTCKCDPDILLCPVHRFSFAHDCSMDLFKIYQTKLKKTNVPLVPAKVQLI